jgi:hypothetical protein
MHVEPVPVCTGQLGECHVWILLVKWCGDELGTRSVERGLLESSTKVGGINRFPVGAKCGPITAFGYAHRPQQLSGVHVGTIPCRTEV